MLRAYSDDYRITPQEAQNIMVTVVQGMTASIIVFTVIRIVERNLDLCEDASKPFEVIKKFT